MTGDPLDRIETWGRGLRDSQIGWGRDVLALVEVARAARPVWAKLIDGSYGRNAQITKSEIDALGAALTRLDGAA